MYRWRRLLANLAAYVFRPVNNKVSNIDLESTRESVEVSLAALKTKRALKISAAWLLVFTLFFCIGFIPQCIQLWRAAGNANRLDETGRLRLLSMTVLSELYAHALFKNKEQNRVAEAMAALNTALDQWIELTNGEESSAEGGVWHECFEKWKAIEQLFFEMESRPYISPESFELCGNKIHGMVNCFEKLTETVANVQREQLKTVFIILLIRAIVGGILSFGMMTSFNILWKNSKQLSDSAYEEIGLCRKEATTVESAFGTVVPLYTERKISLMDAQTCAAQVVGNLQDEVANSPEASCESCASSSIPSSAGAFNWRRDMHMNAATLKTLSGEWIAIPPCEDIAPFLLRFTICANKYHSPEDNSTGYLRFCNNCVTLEGGVLSFEDGVFTRTGKSGTKIIYTRATELARKGP